MEFKPSEYQSEIYNWVENEKGNICIEALAGSGKTSTLVECANLIGEGNNLFVAFNKRIQLELSERLSHTTMKATTLHALGFSIIMSQIAKGNKVIVDNKKTGNIINDLDLDIYREDFFTYINIIKAIKSFCVDFNSKKELDDLFDYMNITDKIDNDYYSNIKKIMEKSNRNIFKIDFEDMIYLPLINNIKKNPKDWIFVDELQDLNNSQFELLDLFIGSKTRVIGVGDQKQGIYKFRHSLLSIMSDFTEKYNCTTFQLPITYRCPKSHIRLVKEHVPTIEAFENNPNGIIEVLDYDDLFDNMEDDAVYIARTNKYVAETVMNLLKNKRKATAYGKDIGKSIQTYIKKYKCKEMNEFDGRLNGNLNKLSDNNKNFNKLIKSESNFNKISSYRKRIRQNEYEIDLIETIMILMNNCTTIKELDKLIEDIFSDNIKGIVCSTIHKIKGLEFDNVYVMQNKLPLLWNNQSDDDIEQEYNLHYVAHTRSKNKIVLVTKEEEKKK